MQLDMYNLLQIGETCISGFGPSSICAKTKEEAFLVLWKKENGKLENQLFCSLMTRCNRAMTMDEGSEDQFDAKLMTAEGFAGFVRA